MKINGEDGNDIIETPPIECNANFAGAQYDDHQINIDGIIVESIKKL